MSVMVLRKECFDRIYKGLVMRGMDRKMTFELMKLLSKENVETFNRRYKSENVSREYTEPRRFEDIVPPVVHQVISDLDAIRYNVDDSAIIAELTTLIDAFEETEEFKSNRRFEEFIVY